MTEPRCTCDEFCDDPCPVHAEENARQDAKIAARNAFRRLQEIAKRAIECGPDRYLVDREGTIVSPKEAREKYRMLPDLILILPDDSTLATTARLFKFADRALEGKWDGIVLRPTNLAVSRDEFLEMLERKLAQGRGKKS